MVHYLVAVDHTDSAIKVLEKAIQLMNAEKGDKLTAVHAVTVGVSTLVRAAALVDPLTGDLSEAQEVDRTENVQFAVKAKALTEGVMKKHDLQFEYVEAFGTPVDVINETIEKIHPDILVLGTRSLNVVQRLFLGSVSTHFVHHATLPVLVVPS